MWPRPSVLAAAVPAGEVVSFAAAAAALPLVASIVPQMVVLRLRRPHVPVRHAHGCHTY